MIFNFVKNNFRMKNLLISISIVLCVISCSNGNQNQTKDTLNTSNVEKENKNDGEYSINGHKLILSSISKTEYDQLSKKIMSVKISKSKSSLKKGNKLTLPLDNTNTKELLDKKDEDETNNVTYKYLGTIDLINQYVVSASYYETSEYILIEKKSGGEIKIWGEPLVSPNLKHLFSYSDALGYDVMPNGIQMWKYEGGKFVLDWELKPEDWKPRSVEWLNETTLLFVKVIPKEFSQKQNDINQYIKLQIK
jgi:hypothetical protein